MGEKMSVSDISDVLKVPAPSQPPAPRHGECVTTMSDTRDAVTTPHPLKPPQENAGASKDELQPGSCACGTARGWDVGGCSQLTPALPHCCFFGCVLLMFVSEKRSPSGLTRGA